MKPPKRWPEVYVEKEFLTANTQVVLQVSKLDDDTYKLLLEHPVFGKTVEIFELDESDDTLCLKSVFPIEMQDSAEEIEIVKDYLNNYLLEGSETYIEYFNKDLGFFLLSRNIGIFPTNPYKE